MKISKNLVWNLAAALVMGLMLEACTHPPVQGLVRSGDTMGPRPWESLFSATIKQDGSWVIAGNRGLILTSADHGKSWHRRSIIDRDLYSLRFSPDEKEAWAVGEDGVIFYSGDGGNTWTRQDSKGHDRLLKVGIIDGQRAVAVGSEGSLLRTQDGGKTWVTKRFQDLTFFDVFMTSSGEGWTVGEFETILHTADAGQTWQVQAGGNEKLFQLGPWFAVDFVSAQNGYVVGLNGMVGATSDGGQKWQSTKLPVDRAMYVTAEQSPQSLWMAGAEGTFIHAKLDQQSTSWAVINPTFNDIADVAIRGNDELAVGLNGTVVYSADGGANWRSMSEKR